MKIGLKRKIFSFIILLIFILILFIIGIGIHLYVNFSVSKIYKNNYGIDIIQPQKIETIYSEGVRDPITLERLVYSEKTFGEALNFDYILPINENVVEKLLNEKFLPFHSSSNAEKLINISSDIVKEGNYYAYFESNGEYYKLFLYDATGNFLYIVTVTF